MTMNIPRIEIYLDENSTLCVAKVENAGAQSRLILDIDLDDLKALKPEDAAYRVGGTVLNILKIWHKEKFDNWVVPPPAPPP